MGRGKRTRPAQHDRSMAGSAEPSGMAAFVRNRDADQLVSWLFDEAARRCAEDIVRKSAEVAARVSHREKSDACREWMRLAVRCVSHPALEPAIASAQQDVVARAQDAAREYRDELDSMIADRRGRAGIKYWLERAISPRDVEQMNRIRDGVNAGLRDISHAVADMDRTRQAIASSHMKDLFRELCGHVIVHASHEQACRFLDAAHHADIVPSDGSSLTAGRRDALSRLARAGHAQTGSMPPIDHLANLDTDGLLKMIETSLNDARGGQLTPRNRDRASDRPHVSPARNIQAVFGRLEAAASVGRSEIIDVTPDVLVQVANHPLLRDGPCATIVVVDELADDGDDAAIHHLVAFRNNGETRSASIIAKVPWRGDDISDYPQLSDLSLGELSQPPRLVTLQDYDLDACRLRDTAGAREIGASLARSRCVHGQAVWELRGEWVAQLACKMCGRRSIKVAALHRVPPSHRLRRELDEERYVRHAHGWDILAGRDTPTLSIAELQERDGLLDMSFTRYDDRGTPLPIGYSPTMSIDAALKRR